MTMILAEQRIPPNIVDYYNDYEQHSEY